MPLSAVPRLSNMPAEVGRLPRCWRLHIGLMYLQVADRGVLTEDYPMDRDLVIELDVEEVEPVEPKPDRRRTRRTK